MPINSSLMIASDRLSTKIFNHQLARLYFLHLENVKILDKSSTVADNNKKT
ncbi:hypothetical protein GTQ43_00670 [Nostoc sp. KVJ3]|uniref:hypothetical protein n=1 Tax=Nostoc sp. KVJ3 TaxID=457945 RepID=UPI002238FEC2|nr:hypothetical protein [Nostoc sp. KVJ3]MCW5312415.1 hypothetical protein [Nostoc sp. KVJ3]